MQRRKTTDSKNWNKMTPAFESVTRVPDFALSAQSRFCRGTACLTVANKTAQIQGILINVNYLKTRRKFSGNGWHIHVLHVIDTMKRKSYLLVGIEQQYISPAMTTYNAYTL